MTLRPCVARAAVLAAPLFACGCDEGSPASPTFQAESIEAGIANGYAVCPPEMDAGFGSIYAQMLQTSCGIDQANSCHSTSGAFGMLGSMNHLDFSIDAGAVYTELVGPDAGGQRAANVNGHASVLRVVPGDAGASMLYIKLTLTSPDDPNYGSGMPFNAPGSVCPAALDAVKTWIDQGAAQD